MQRNIPLWFFASLALTVSMLVKEIAVAGERGSFHWSYNLVMSGAALSLFFASGLVYRYERMFAVSGFLCCAVALFYLGRPTL